jgi:uncharacterized RDD family membrane protein YckC
MESNPYQAPAAVVADVATDAELAGRGTRFAAAFIDGLLMLALVLPLMYFGGYFKAVTSGAQPGFGTQLAWALIGLVVFVLVQAYPLSRTAQTWGKRAMGIKITDLGGGKPPLASLIARRYVPVQVAAAIPLLGNVLALVNVLFIFRTDRRCVHDLIAGTRVVKA